MTDKEINRTTINAFLARAINRAGLTDIDTEFGLHVLDATVIDSVGVRVQLAGGHIVYVDFTHVIPHPHRSKCKETKADAHR